MKNLILPALLVCAVLLALPRCSADTAAATVEQAVSEPKNCFVLDFETGESPCSEEEYQAQAMDWNQRYGCDARGCGFIDFDALPDPTAGVVLESAK